MEPSRAAAATHSLGVAPKRRLLQRAPHAWSCPPSLQAGLRRHHEQRIDHRQADREWRRVPRLINSAELGSGPESIPYKIELIQTKSITYDDRRQSEAKNTDPLRSA